MSSEVKAITPLYFHKNGQLTKYETCTSFPDGSSVSFPASITQAALTFILVYRYRWGFPGILFVVFGRTRSHFPLLLNRNSE